jgi:hypothetical protein
VIVNGGELFDHLDLNERRAALLSADGTGNSLEDERSLLSLLYFVDDRRPLLSSLDSSLAMAKLTHVSHSRILLQKTSG